MNNCQARAKLQVSDLESILAQTARTLHEQGRTERWKGRRVVVDGTGLSMPDTLENQAIWPQTRGQKPGCSFPQATVCACFCLHTGALLSHRMGSRKSHEVPLLRQQHDQFQAGDIFLGDKGFFPCHSLTDPSAPLSGWFQFPIDMHEYSSLKIQPSLIS